MNKIDLGKARVFMIDKETGEQHELEGPVEVTHIGDVLLPDDVLPKDFDAQMSYTWTLKLSKRKSRKFSNFIKYLCNPRKRKYYSKREKIRAIHKAAEEANMVPMVGSDDELMRNSSKQLRAILLYLHEQIANKNNQEI